MSEKLYRFVSGHQQLDQRNHNSCPVARASQSQQHIFEHVTSNNRSEHLRYSQTTGDSQSEKLKHGSWNTNSKSDHQIHDHVTNNNQSDFQRHNHFTNNNQSDHQKHNHVTYNNQLEEPDFINKVNTYQLHQLQSEQLVYDRINNNQSGKQTYHVILNSQPGAPVNQGSFHTNIPTSSVGDTTIHVSAPLNLQGIQLHNSSVQQLYREQSPQSDKTGEESQQSLLCLETFISPTPPSDDCGGTLPYTSVIWTHCENSEKVTAINTQGRILSENACKSSGPLSHVQFHSKIGREDTGELLKAALLGETGLFGDNTSENRHLKKDINSNFQTKYADESLKFPGNEVNSGRRMSGSNGFDRNRMTGSLNGGGNNTLSQLSDASGGQGHSQPQVATAEGMLLGHLGSTGGVALHDIGSRSIVTGSVGAGPQVTLGSVFRPPQSVSDTGRYPTAAFSTAAGTSAVGPYSPLYAAGSHSAVGPYSAFYTQYPYSSGVMHGTLDPQFGSYSAVLQSMGTHAAQSQVPRSPYGSAASQANVLGQYALHMPRTTSPGGKTYIANANLSSHDREENKYRRETELDKRRYSTGVIKEEKPHHFSVPSGFAEPARVTFASNLRESPSHSRDPQDYYKVPAGREGSLKHRILRPSDSTSSVPLGTPLRSAFTNTDEPFAKRTKVEHSGVEKSNNRHSSQLLGGSPSSSDVAQGRSTHLHYPQHFMKGSIIQLGNGEMKRVEDLETDDFRHSADVSSDLKLDSSTVTQIEENEDQGTALLGFVVGEHKIQVTVEATVEHPFFVFGQGWSSCEPAWTHKRYGLECQKLSVGDVCISLTHKDVTEHAAEILQQQKQLKLEGNTVFDKEIKSESSQNIHRESPGQGHSSRSPRSPVHSQSPGTQGQGQSYRSESGHYNESSTPPVKGERLFDSMVPSRSPSSSQTQEQILPPSTTS